MKKIFAIMAMMLIAASVSAQTDMNAVFNIGENAKKLELQKIEEDSKRERDKIEFNFNLDRVEEFANSLRREGVDVTAFTDADIDRLDSIRISKRKLNIEDKFKLPFGERFYEMPSDHFKRAMMIEKEYYLKIYFYGDHTFKPNSTVIVGSRKINVNGKEMKIEDGDTLKVGSATIIYSDEHRFSFDWPIDAAKLETKISKNTSNKRLKSRKKSTI